MERKAQRMSHEPVSWSLGLCKHHVEDTLPDAEVIVRIRLFCLTLANRFGGYSVVRALDTRLRCVCWRGL
jgi:hypothetical protein